MDKNVISLEDFANLLVEDANPNLQLADPTLVQYYSDLKERVYWINDTIGDNYLDLISKIIRWNREDRVLPPDARKPIKIFFNSPGGSLDIEESLVSVIELSETPIYGFALGMVASAASLIYLACHKRYALKNAYFIMHKGSANLSGSYDDVEAAMSDYKAQIEKMQQFYITHTQYTPDEIQKGLTRDWYVRIPEAKEKGIVTDIIEKIGVML